MLIGLISDTHIPDRARQIPEKVLQSFENVDLIIHAGDLTTMDVINKLEETAPVVAIQGNMDRVAGLDLPKARVIECEGVKIGVAHGEVYPRADTQQLLYLAKQLDVNIFMVAIFESDLFVTDEQVTSLFTWCYSDLCGGCCIFYSR